MSAPSPFVRFRVVPDGEHLAVALKIARHIAVIDRTSCATPKKL
jgi:hypothetical protein